MAHAVSVTFTRFERMSPPAAVLALLLHALVAFLLWWSSPLHHTEEPEEKAVEVTMEAPPPPPEPKPEPKPAPEAPKPPPPQAQQPKPAPPPPPVTAYTPFQPAAPLDKKNEGADKPSDRRPEVKPAEKVEEAAPQKSEEPKAEEPKAEPPQQALAKPPEPPPPAPQPPTLEKELPPVEAPSAPLTSRDIPKPAPRAPEPKPQPQPPQPQAQPRPPQLAPSPLSRLPPRGSPPPSAGRDAGPPPSPFVNPADVRARNDVQNAYLQRVVYRVETQRGTDGNPAWLRLRMGVHVVIARDGRLLQVSMAQSSGNPEADRVMMQTFRDAAPFAPVPPELPGETFSFTLPFSFVAR